MINVYVTHYASSRLDGINDILIDQLYQMQRTIESSDAARIVVVYWTSDPSYEEDLRGRIPPGIELVRNDRPGRADVQPSLRNKVLDHARDSNCEAIVLLHNDVRLARGSLQRLVADWRWAAERWGRDQVVVSPSYIPYHLGDPNPAAVTKADFWADLRKHSQVLSEAAMRTWCSDHGVMFADGEVVCKGGSKVEDDGTYLRQLMMFIADRAVFDTVGYCDERYTGADYDDNDWAIRSLQCGKRHLRSAHALVGHITRLSFTPLETAPEWRTQASDNKQLFIDKWGQRVFDEMVSGRLWERLRGRKSEGECSAPRDRGPGVEHPSSHGQASAARTQEPMRKSRDRTLLRLQCDAISTSPSRYLRRRRP